MARGLTACKHRSDAKGADEPNGCDAEIHGEPHRTTDADCSTSDRPAVKSASHQKASAQD